MNALKHALMLQYGGTRYGNPFEALKVLHQVGTIKEYIETFEFVSSQVSKLSEQQYVDFLFYGRVEARNQVKGSCASTFNQMASHAIDS